MEGTAGTTQVSRAGVGTAGWGARAGTDRSASVLLGFGQVVIAVSQQARRLGLVVPAFRSPKGGGGVRSVRRHGDGPPTVMVPYRGRTLPAVAADIVAGVLAVNPGAVGVEADLLRAAGLPPSRMDPAA